MNPRGTGQVPFLSQILGTGVGFIFASIFFQKKTLRQWSAAGDMQQKPIMLWHKMPFFYYLQDTNYCYHCSGDIWAIKQLWLYLYLQRQQYIFFGNPPSLKVSVNVIRWSHVQKGADSSFARSHRKSNTGTAPCTNGVHPKPFQATNESEERSRTICIIQDGMDHNKFGYLRSRSFTSKEFHKYIRPSMDLTCCIVHGKFLLLAMSEPCFAVKLQVGLFKDLSQKIRFLHLQVSKQVTWHEWTSISSTFQSAFMICFVSKTWDKSWPSTWICFRCFCCTMVNHH